MIKFLILLLSLFAIRPYLHQNFPYTHDGENHLARFANYKVAIREGQFPPRFAPNLMNHYGYPVFNYNYPLANILSLPFSFLKINYEWTFKILVFGFVFLGLVGVNRWLKILGFKNRPRIFALFTFANTPYLISALAFRGNIGEIMAMCLFPWLLVVIEEIKATTIQHKKTVLSKIPWLKAIIVFTAFLLSHNVSVLFGLPLVLLYMIFRFEFKKWSYYANFLSIFVSSIGLSLWFWLPAIFEKKFVVLDNANLSQNFINHFPTIDQLLFSPLEFGFSKVGSVDSLTFGIGLASVLVLVASGFLTWKGKFSRNRIFSQKISILFLFFCLALLFFQLKVMAPIWQIMPLANFIQFPWRLTLFLGIFILPLSALVFEKLHTLSTKNFLGKIMLWSLISILAVQILGVLRIKPADYFHKQNIDYDAFTQSTSTAHENLPKDFTYAEFADWQPTPSILGKDSDAQIEVIKWNGTHRYYKIKANHNSIIAEPTMYFPGWETTIESNGEKNKVDYIFDDHTQGRIAYFLEENPNEYYIETHFTQKTWPRILGNGVGLLFGLIVVLYLIFKKSVPNPKKTNSKK